MFMALKKDPESAQDAALAKAKKDALRLLSFRARSIQELRGRLMRKNHPPALVEQVLEFCLKQGLLDDEKFAKLYALSRIQSRPVGKNLIQRDLQSKGVSAQIVQQALGTLVDFDEKQTALDMATRRHQRMSGLDENVSKARLYGFLKRRGFTGEAVFYALTQLYKGAESFE